MDMSFSRVRVAECLKAMYEPLKLQSSKFFWFGKWDRRVVSEEVRWDSRLVRKEIGGIFTRSQEKHVSNLIWKLLGKEVTWFATRKGVRLKSRECAQALGLVCYFTVLMWNTYFKKGSYLYIDNLYSEFC